MIRNAVIEIKGKVNYSWRVASRRGAATPKIILPGLLEPVPDVVCLIDTSGSMSGKALGQAIAIVGKGFEISRAAECPSYLRGCCNASHTEGF